MVDGAIKRAAQSHKKKSQILKSIFEGRANIMFTAEQLRGKWVYGPSAVNLHLLEQEKIGSTVQAGRN